MKLRKAVFPAAGFGTRFLPVTKASPKEMLPLVDKPLIQYGVEEAVACGLREIILITGRGKSAIEDHFDYSLELDTILERRGHRDLLEEMRKISNMSICYTRQKEPLGLGHAILCARPLVHDEAFAVFLGDEVLDAPIPVMAQMLAVYERQGCSILAVQRVPREQVFRYGVIEGEPAGNGLYRVRDVVEKPQPEEAPSDLAIIGRYILTPPIFDILEQTPAGKNGEIQLTDAIRGLLRDQAVYALEFEGQRFDAGDKLGFLQANIVFALKRPDLGPELRQFLRTLRLG
ncbi:MAG: UTP--glucose-1-phosphate uridylyltransferase GalU [Deltaproteobacteria bacterium]|nr:UTP--glucose-1-phosphate uridylyltransferase GalU [Deltaproteobacteria bacterium]